LILRASDARVPSFGGKPQSRLQMHLWWESPAINLLLLRMMGPENRRSTHGIMLSWQNMLRTILHAAAS